MKDHLYMVSAWAVRNRLCPVLQKVDGKSNELTTIPETVKVLVPARCIMTIDVASCQKTITEIIINAEADYIPCIEDNQKKTGFTYLTSKVVFSRMAVMVEKNIENVFVLPSFTRNIFIPDGRG